MDNSITQNSENKKRYLPHDLNTKIHAVEMYRNNGDIEYTCRKYHISRYSLWRWHVENIIFLDIHYGDGIKNMMEHQRV